MLPVTPTSNFLPFRFNIENADARLGVILW
jgi:hypothetical protein